MGWSMLAKAKLIEIRSFAVGTSQADPVPVSSGGISVDVQFNPESLKVSLANNNRGGNQPGGGSGRQFVGSGTSNLQVEFVFDTTADSSDVRRRTERVAQFVMAREQPGDPNNRRTPPRCGFEWGSFIFEGVVDSMEETLDYFSEEGVPLRATVSLRLSRDDIDYVIGTARPPAGPSGVTTPGAAGQAPLAAARPGESVQRLAARNGLGGDWKTIAAANGIDDPLRLSAGALLNVSGGARAGAAVGLGASGGAAASAGGAIGAGVSAGAAAGFSAGAAAGFSAGAAAGFSAGLGGGVGFGAGATGAATLGAGGGIGAGAGASAGGGLAAGAGIGVRAGVGVNAGVGGQVAAGATGRGGIG
jgi:hypothetical protein